MDVGVQVGDSAVVGPDRVGEGGDALRVVRVAAPAVVGGAALRAVAVYVHVGELAGGALDVEDVGVGQVVAAV